jgi:SOS response regulatory protein OraA/RecX
MKKGSRHSMESRLKMSESIKQVRDKIIARHLGSKRTGITCERIRRGLRRYWASQEVRDRKWKRLKRLQRQLE